MADAKGYDFHWDEKECGSEMKVEGWKVTKTGYYDCHTVYEAKPAPYDPLQPVCIKYTLKINSTGTSRIRIGIINHNDYLNDDFTNKDKRSKFYAIHGANGNIGSHKTHYEFTKWNKNAYFEQGDTVTFELNYISKCIKFHKNGQLIGTMFSRIDCGRDIKYRLAVSMKSSRDCVELIDYSTTQANMMSGDEIYAQQHRNDDDNNNDTQIEIDDYYDAQVLSFYPYLVCFRL